MLNDEVEEEARILGESPPSAKEMGKKKKPTGAEHIFGAVVVGALFGSPGNEPPVVTKKPELQKEVRDCLLYQHLICLSVYSLL